MFEKKYTYKFANKETWIEFRKALACANGIDDAGFDSKERVWFVIITAQTGTCFL